MHYFPIGGLGLLIFGVLLAILVVMFEAGVLRYIFESLGVSRRYMLALLAGCLLGSYVNIPIATLPTRQLHSAELVDFFGSQYIVPVVVNWPGTVLAINLGGAIIPVIVSLYLMARNSLFVEGLLATGLVTLVVHWVARPVPGVGIAVPLFMPPLVTAIIALSISPRHAAPLAYIAGSLGTLLGADLLNLNRIQGLGAPVASIGGAGKFDGIFLTGIVAVLIAGLLGGWRRQPPRILDEFGAPR